MEGQCSVVCTTYSAPAVRVAGAASGGWGGNVRKGRGLGGHNVDALKIDVTELGFSQVGDG